jgi:predicted protein tyrosine phosphatase
MDIIVLNRGLIQQYYSDTPHILISICDPCDVHPPLPQIKARVGTLQLKFHDFNGTKCISIRKDNYVDKSGKMVAFSRAHAKKILSFVKKHTLEIGLIVCQCDGGISRSAGVAAALSKCFNQDDSFFFKCYLPNSLVYSTILKEWHGV